MNCHIGLILGLLVVGLTGCATPENRTQLHVVGPPALRGLRMPITDADRAAIKEVVREVATSLKCVERTSTSFNPQVITSFAQEDRDEPYFVEAFNYENYVVVDLRHEPLTLGESAKYRRVRTQLINALKSRFGSRLVVPDRFHQVRNIRVPVAPVR